MFTGLWHSWYENGIVATEINYNNCQDYCIERDWDENGKFVIELNLPTTFVYSE